MAEYTRILLRQGPDSLKNSVVLKAGEPAYITDYERLVVGDGTTGGGVTIGSKFLGFCVFDSVSLEVFNVKPGYPGDIIFEESTNLMYVLSGNETVIGKKAYQIKTNYVPINKTPLPDNTSIVDREGALGIADEGVDGRYIASYALGNGLRKNQFNPLVIEMTQPSSELGFVEGVLQINDAGVTNAKLADMGANTIKGRLNNSGRPEDIDIETLKGALGLVGAGGAGAFGVPIGTIIDYAGVDAPVNYLPCDGRELSRTEYLELFSAIGTTWGAPNISTFNVPNLNKRTTIGSGAPSGTGSAETIRETVGSYGGSQNIFLASRHLPRHSHKIDFTVPGHVHNFTINIPQFGGAFEVGDIVTNGYNNYITIIRSTGPDDISPQDIQTIPSGPDANTILRNEAYNIIKSNKPYIQQRVIDYVNSAFPYALSSIYTDSRGLTGSLSAVCYRDSGYITDSIAADILNNANHRSVETGNLYFSGFITQQRLNVANRSVPSLPEDQYFPTIKAIEAIGSFIAGVNMPPSPLTNYTNLGLLSGGQFTDEIQKVVISALSNFTTTIANSGNVPVTTPTNSLYLDSTYLSAASDINAFKKTLQARVVDYVNYNFPYALSGTNFLTNEALSAKCFRDTGYIIDSLVADILNDANHRSVETGLFYFSGAVLAKNSAYSSSVPTLPQDQVFATIQAISSIGKFITGLTMPVERNYTTNGVLSSLVYYNSQQNKALGSLGNFTTIIDTGIAPITTPAGSNAGIVGSDSSYLSASNLILRYRSALQQQIVEYVKYYFPVSLSGVSVEESNALSAKCFRDTGYIVDALAADIRNNANHRSVETGQFYFNGAVLNRFSNPGSPVPTLPTNQVDATIAAISALAIYINGDNIPTLPTPFTTTGILSANTGADTRKSQVASLVSTMHYPLRTNGSSLSYSPAGSATNDDISLATLIASNKSSIQNVVSSYVFEKGYLMTPANQSQTDMVSYYNNFIDVINNPNNVPVTEPAGFTISNLNDAALIIANNRSVLQRQVVDFVLTNYTDALSGPSFSESSSLSSKCFRDTGYLIDSLVADLRNNANHRSVETGVFYFSGAVLARMSNPNSSIPTLPTNQVTSTITAISALGALITGNTIATPLSVYNYAGILSGTATQAASSINTLISNMVYPLQNNGAQVDYMPAGNPSATNVALANTLLENKTTIQRLVSSYVLKKNYLTTVPETSAINTAKCNRDVGFMIDAVANDLKTGVIAKSIQYAVAYWDGSTSRIPDSNIPNQTANTLDVIEYLKKMSLYYANFENTVKCNRDVGFMLDAVINDLQTGTNARSIQYGVAYWDGSTSRIPDSNIPNQRGNTLDVVRYLSSALEEVLVNNSNVLTNRVIKKVNTLIKTMIFPLENNGASQPYLPAGSTNEDKIALADRILANKEAIQNSVTNYVIYRNYLVAGSDLLAKCKRDVGFMIDAVANDLKTGVNAKSVQYALSYWDGSASRLREVPGTEIQNQRRNTIDTIEFLLSQLLTYTGAPGQINILKEVMDLTKDMVFPLLNGGRLPTYRPAGPPLTPDRQTAIDVLRRNKANIQLSTRQYVNSLAIIAGNTEPWLTLQEKCNRDVGYMIDSIIEYLRTGVNARPIQYALSYWDGTKNRIGGDNRFGIPNQINDTISTLRFLRDETKSVLTRNGVGDVGNVRYDGTTNSTPATATGQFTFDGFTGSGDDQLFNDPVPNMQPSAVVNKCIKAR